MLSSATRVARGAIRSCQPVFAEAGSSRQPMRVAQPALTHHQRQPASWRGLQSSSRRFEDKRETERLSEAGAVQGDATTLDSAQAQEAATQDSGGFMPKPDEIVDARAEAAADGETSDSNSAARAKAALSQDPPILASSLPGLGLSESLLAPQASEERAPTPAMPGSPREGGFRSSPFSYTGLTRGSEPFKLHIHVTRNNTIMTLTTPKGAPVSTVSSGTVGFTKAARSSYDAGYRTAMTMFQRIEENRVPWRMATLELIWNGFGQGREAVFRALQTDDGTAVRNLVRRMRDSTRIKVGGTRAPKRRMY